MLNELVLPAWGETESESECIITTPTCEYNSGVCRLVEDSGVNVTLYLQSLRPRQGYMLPRGLLEASSAT